MICMLPGVTVGSKQGHATMTKRKVSKSQTAAQRKVERQQRQAILQRLVQIANENVPQAQAVGNPQQPEANE